MSQVTFEYDPFRGGFCLKLGPFVRDRHAEAFGGLLRVFSDESGQIAAIESFWDHGGLPLHGIHETAEWPQGLFLIPKSELRVGKLLLRQNPEKLQLWFGTDDDVPQKNWFRQDDTGTGAVTWFSPQTAKAGWPVPHMGRRAECNLVTGLAVDFSRTVANYPVSSLRISIEDFK